MLLDRPGLAAGKLGGHIRHGGDPLFGVMVPAEHWQRLLVGG